MAKRPTAKATRRDDVPTAVIVVQNGIAEVRGVSGRMRIHLVDADLEGEMISRDQVERMLAGEVRRGTEQDVRRALRSARRALGEFLESPALRP